MVFAERLKYLRKDRGCTQKQVYEAVGLSALVEVIAVR
jgi:transcriptional regulator with XRE-family HTH domain